MALGLGGRDVSSEMATREHNRRLKAKRAEDEKPRYLAVVWVITAYPTRCIQSAGVISAPWKRAKSRSVMLQRGCPTLTLRSAKLDRLSLHCQRLWTLGSRRD